MRVTRERIQHRWFTLATVPDSQSELDAAFAAANDVRVCRQTSEAKRPLSEVLGLGGSFAGVTTGITRTSSMPDGGRHWRSGGSTAFGGSGSGSDGGAGGGLASVLGGASGSVNRLEALLQENDGAPGGGGGGGSGGDGGGLGASIIEENRQRRATADPAYGRQKSLSEAAAAGPGAAAGAGGGGFGAAGLGDLGGLGGAGGVREKSSGSSSAAARWTGPELARCSERTSMLSGPSSLASSRKASAEEGLGDGLLTAEEESSLASAALSAEGSEASPGDGPRGGGAS